MRSPDFRSLRHTSIPSTFRHEDVKHDRIGAVSAQETESLGAVCCDFHVVTVQRQRPRERAPNPRFVVHDEDAHATSLHPQRKD